MKLRSKVKQTSYGCCVSGLSAGDDVGRRGKATGGARGPGQAEGRSEQDEGLAVICLLLLLCRTKTTWMEGEKQRVEVR